MEIKEKNLFTELCKFKNRNVDLNKADLEQYTNCDMLGKLFFNRMNAIAYGVLKERNLLGQINREFKNPLADSYRQNKEKNISYFKCVNMLSDILFEHKNRYAMLKGALLCGLYPGGYRTANDIDLLVRPGDITKIGDKLLKEGFIQGDTRSGKLRPADRSEIIESKMTRGETVPYILEVNLPYMPYLEVDINFSLDYKNGDKNTLDDMLYYTASAYNGHGKIITLEKSDFFIHLCSHIYKEASTLPWIKMRRDMTLYKYCDIYMLLHDFSPEDFHELFRRADKLGMADICACVIKWTCGLFKLDNPYANEFARYYLKNNEYKLHQVTVPSTNKKLVYSEKDIRERFFSKDRMKLLG